MQYNRSPDLTRFGVAPQQRPARLALLALACAALAACTTVQPEAPGHLTARPSTVPAPADLGMRDLRAEFRRAFCVRLPQQPDCARILLRLPGEPTQAVNVGFEPPDALADRFRLAFVPGLLAGCAGSLAMPFADTADALRAAGFDARILSIDGRGSPLHNADLIERQIADPDPRPWIVFGYSKGLPDILEMLVKHPGARKDIAAVVSYAGAVGGSRLADDAGGLSMTLLEHVPMPGCEAGDGSDLQSLRRDVRHTWWQAHHLELRVPFYTLAAAARSDRVSSPLRDTYAALSRTDGLNDGQLAVADAMVPGSALLGYVNADHWAMAIPLSRQLPVLKALFIDDLPRADLVLAAVQVIARHTSSSHEKPPHP